MTITPQALGEELRALLEAEPGPPGREKARDRLGRVLLDPEFLSRYLRDDTGERELLYEDPKLGFCILAHYYRGPKDSPPHDHGPSWAIYGQAAGETLMNDYELLEPAAPERPGKVRKTRSYRLAPGAAHLYNEGDLHSPHRAASTRLIRIEGVNLEKVRRLKYEATA
jgi:predicted metal-dependent enzyme (double-stranded beta helix superfamily)